MDKYGACYYLSMLGLKLIHICKRGHRDICKQNEHQIWCGMYTPPVLQVLIYAFVFHYSDVIMDMIAFQITSLTIVYSNVYSGAD